MLRIRAERRLQAQKQYEEKPGVGVMGIVCQNLSGTIDAAIDLALTVGDGQVLPSKGAFPGQKSKAVTRCGQVTA